MPSPKPEPVVLSDGERQVLQGWARRRKTAQALALRSRIVLRSAEGGTIGQVAAELGVSRDMVSKWRRRFLSDRLAGLSDEPRPGRPRTVGDEQVQRVMAKTLEEAPPAGDTHWSTRSMAAATGMSQSTVSRIWRAYGLKPGRHRARSRRPRLDQPVEQEPRALRLDQDRRRDPAHPRRLLLTN